MQIKNSPVRGIYNKEDTMDRFEMIEKLRERADISYEEARNVMEQANGDLLEALVLLEKQGKLSQSKAAAADAAGETGADAGAAGAKAADPAQEAGGKKKRDKGPLGKAFHNAGSFLAHTAFHVTYESKELFVMPSWTFALLMLFFWEVLVPMMLISLFFNVRYFFDGDEDVEAANEVLAKAGSFADGFESGLKKEEPAQTE